MTRRLSPHPDGPAPPLVVEAAARPDPGRLKLHFRIEGDLSGIALPPPGKPERTDGLWAHTCLEAFIRQQGDAGYWELNFSPSGAWAAYRFDGYRQGMRPADLTRPPQSRFRRTPQGCELEAEVALADMPDPGRGLRLGLSAVIEARGGAKSYWALAHPPGRPDFHHADCFVLQLPEAGRP